jgi:hypothetical protein
MKQRKVELDQIYKEYKQKEKLDSSLIDKIKSLKVRAHSFRMNVVSLELFTTLIFIGTSL